MSTLGRAFADWPTATSPMILMIWSTCIAVIGLLLIAAPAASAILILTMIALCWIVGGVVAALAAAWERPSGWGWQCAGAVAGVLAGLAVIAYPIFSAIVAVEALFVVLSVSVLIVAGVTLAASHSVGSVVFGLALLAVGCAMLFAPFHVVALATLVQWIGLLCLAGGFLTGVSIVAGGRSATAS